jgi:hypothetical protein
MKSALYTPLLLASLALAAPTKRQGSNDTALTYAGVNIAGE